MEKIKRALEIARAVRGQQAEAEAFPGVTHEFVQRHVQEHVQERAREDTPVWRTPVQAVDDALLARNRVLSAGQSGVAAAPYKMLRTQVLRRMEQLGATTLAIISPGANDGKTLTAVNLAISLVSDPHRTALVVDFDLRNPTLADRFGLTPTVGVEECLRGEAPLERALLRPQGYDRLTLLPARQAIDHSSELLGSARTGEIVAELRSRYANRIVLFDVAPVLGADDALSFSRHVQAALLVVSEGHTRREDITQAIQLLRDTPIVGTVLNASRGQPGRYY